MILIDGKPSDNIDALDRGLHYGDGLFETIRVVGGEPALWDYHWDRLNRGCHRLGIPAPDPIILQREISEAVPQTGVAKVMVTRGSAGRGYRPPEEPAPRRLVLAGEMPAWPDAWRESGVTVRWCETRLARQPVLAGLKHLNRLEQVMARREWSDGAIAEGLMRDEAGYVVEGTMSNLFIVERNRLTTPPLDHCGVEGVMRRRVMELARESGLDCSEERLSPERLTGSAEAFLTNALIGIWPVAALGEQRWEIGPVTRALRDQLGF